MAFVVKLITNDDGDKTDDKSWHLVVNTDGSDRTACSGEVFGEGESKAMFKTNIDGKITCSKCRELVKWYKSIKL
jgi:hypothetical protein